MLFKKESEFCEGKVDGLEIVLDRHIAECFERYKVYLQRHDDLSKQLNESIAATQIKFEKALDKQTDKLWGVVMRAITVSTTLILSVISGVIVFGLTHGFAT